MFKCLVVIAEVITYFLSIGSFQVDRSNDLLAGNGDPHFTQSMTAPTNEHVTDPATPGMYTCGKEPYDI